MNILEESRHFYSKVIEYHKKINYDTRLNFIWENNMSDIAKIANSSSSAEELINKVTKTFMFSIDFAPENAKNTGVWQDDNDVPHIRDKQINWLLSKLEYNLFALPDHIQESPFIHHRNQTVRDGRVLSGNFLRTVSSLQRIIKHVKFSNILELGGGTGHQARTFLLFYPNCKYTIVDLPETLIFSYTFIRLNFPDKKVLYVSSEEDLNKIDDDYEFVFVPAVFADHLAGRSYDLFINVASMGEMRNDVIHYWMDLIQNRLNIKALFTLNRFLNTVDEAHAALRIYENECTTIYDANWNILNWEIEPIYCRCPYIDTLHSRYVEIVAQKEPGANLVERSDNLLQDALDEDWYRLKGYYGDGIMQMRNNGLVNDTTMTGTLFKLWESIRLNKNIRNVSAMLEYLERLTVKHPFEEKFYYEKLLSAI